MPNQLLSVGLTWPLVANQLYACPARACYITVQGTVPQLSNDGIAFAAIPASGIIAAAFMKSTGADTIVTLKPV